MRWLKYGLLISVIVISLVIVFAGVSTGTDTGSHWLIEQTRRFLPGELKIEQIEGNLLNRLHLKNVRYQQDELDVHIQDLILAWRPWALTGRTLIIEQVKIDNATIQLPPPGEASPPSQEPFELPEIRLPVAIELQDIALNNIRIKPPGGLDPIIIEHAQLKAQANDTLTIETLQVRAETFAATAELTGSLGLLRPHALNIQLVGSAQLPEVDETAISLTATGDINVLNVQAEASAPVNLQLTGELKQLLTQPAWDLALNWDSLQYPLIDDAPLIQLTNGEVKTKGNLNGYQVQLQLAASGQQVPPSQWQLRAKGDLQQLQLETLRGDLLDGFLQANGAVQWQPALQGEIQVTAQHLQLAPLLPELPPDLAANAQLTTVIENNQLELQTLLLTLDGSPLRISGSGTADLTQPAQPDLDLQLDWQQVQYPLSGADPVIALDRGELTVKGQPSAWQVALQTAVDGTQVPAGQWRLQAEGDSTQAQITQLRGQTLQGVLSGTAQAQWSPQLNAALELDGRQLVLTELWPDWPADSTLETRIKAVFADNLLTLQQAQVQIPQTQTTVNTEGTVNLADPAAPQFDIVSRWQKLRWPLSGDTLLAELPTGQVTVSGTPAAYQADLSTQLQGEQVPKSDWQVSLTGSAQQATLKQLNGQLLQGQLQGTGQVQWQPTLQATLKLNAQQLVLTELVPEWSKELGLDSQIKVQFKDQRLQLEQVAVQVPKTGAELTLTGQADLNTPDNPRFKMRTDWQKLQYPPTGTPQVASKQGTVTLDGELNDYRLSVKAHAGGTAVPTSQLQLSGRGTQQQITIPDLQLNTLDGVINMDAQAQWLPHVSWRVDVTGNNIDPGQHWAELAGQLNLQLRSRGTLKDHLQASVDLTSLDGQLRGYPLSVTANATANGNRYDLNSFKLRSGDNTLTAEAGYGDTLAAEWQLNAPDLAALLPDGKGSLRGSGTVSGRPDAPQVVAELRGENLGMGALAIQQVTADVNANLQNLNSPLTLKLAIDEVQQDGKTVLAQATLNGDGSLAQHQIRLNVQAPTQTLALQLDGGLQTAQQRWQGALQQLTLDFTDSLQQFGRWRLPQPAPLTLAADNIQLQNACLQQQNGDGTACLSVQQQATGSELQLQLTALPLSLAYPDVSGALAGQLQANYQANGAIRADGTFNISPGALTTEVEGKSRTVPHQGGTLTLRIGEQGLVSTLNLSLLERSGIEGTVALPDFNRLPFLPDQRIQASITGQLSDLSVLPTFVPTITEAKGALSMNLWASGTVNEPLIGGEVLMREGALDIPSMGLELRNIQLEVLGDKEKFGTVSIQASAESGDGQLSITGSGNALTQVAKVKIQGKNFRAINSVDAFVVISPDLTIAVDGEKVNVRGSLTVPEANITPNLVISDGSTSVGGAVRSSQDVVIVNDPDAVEEPEAPGLMEKLALSMNVLVRLGNEIHVDAVGFKSQIGGQIRLTHRPTDIDLIPTANGEIQVIDGTFRSYGQDLEIERGRIIFANTLVTQPTLNIKAVRRIYGGQEVEVAGVHITGNPDQINLNLFSEPSVPQDQILSYILTGQAFDPNDENRVVGLGTYILPNLYVSYGISLLDQTNVFNVRYELNRTWGVEMNIAEEDKGIDFSYTLER